MKTKKSSNFTTFFQSYQSKAANLAQLRTYINWNSQVRGKEATLHPKTDAKSSLSKVDKFK